MQTGRCCCYTVDFGLGCLPIRSYKESDIIPVFDRTIGRLGGGSETEECVGESMKQYEETEGNVTLDQRSGIAIITLLEVCLTSGLQETLTRR